MRLPTFPTFGAGVVGALVLIGGQASAQGIQTSTVQGTFTDVISAALGRAGSFEAGEAGAVIAGAIGAQINTFPVPSSGGAFSYVFDPNAGLLRRATRSFGPALSQRPLTTGRPGSITFGLQHQRLRFDRIDSLPLDSLQLHSNSFTHIPGFKSEARAELDVKANLTTFSVVAAVRDDLDISVDIPYVETAVSVIAIDDLTFSNGDREQRVVTGSATSSGLGDIMIQAKHRLDAGDRGGLAVIGEIQLPTGSEPDARGLGAYRMAGTFVAAFPLGGIVPHLNVGYAYWSKPYEERLLFGDTIAPAQFSHHHEYNFAGGVDTVVSDSVTIAASIRGRILQDFRKAGYEVIERTTGEFSYTVGSFYLLTEPAHLVRVLASAGMKWNVPRTSSLVSMNVIVPVTDSGLHAKPAFSVGFEYAF